ncbi:sensor histidine kinase [Taibaiella koreensis]|uniref:sensor histidine kinase n=1 Tax=Taibaiella koreensis TaxID=1268548 RepID=UPI0013C33569|nr:histidine kinase [Taibaiella koreensis]
MAVSKNKLAVAHAAFWLLYITFALLTYGAKPGVLAVAKETLVSYALSIGVFYTHYFILNRYLSNRSKPWHYFFSFLGLIALNFCVKYLSFIVIWPYIFGEKSEPIASGESIGYMLIIFTWQALTFLILSAGYWAAERLLWAEKTARIKDQQLAAAEKIELENAALRAQINPHFVLNSLEHLAGESEHKLPHVAAFAHAMMVYMQSSIGVPGSDGQIKLEEEVGALEALIHIYRQRFPEAHIKYQKSIPEGLRIAPHTLTPFVENAFKHGDFSQPNEAMLVLVEYLDGSLYFSSYNKKNRRLSHKSRGIGLAYVKRQLESAFAGNYELEINDDADRFIVNLRIDQLDSGKRAAPGKKALSQ